ncbi:hypothetical protein A2U01_0119142, partial [Trifolium medium]|nr:hypothetical protein [Trifolium medium]
RKTGLPSAPGLELLSLAQLAACAGSAEK